MLLEQFRQTLHTIYAGVLSAKYIDRFVDQMATNRGIEHIKADYYDTNGKFVYKAVAIDIDCDIGISKEGYIDVLSKYMKRETAECQMTNFYEHEERAYLLDYLVTADRTLRVEFSEPDHIDDVQRYVQYCWDTETIVSDDMIAYQYVEFCKITHWSTRVIAKR